MRPVRRTEGRNRQKVSKISEPKDHRDIPQDNIKIFAFVTFANIGDMKSAFHKYLWHIDYLLIFFQDILSVSFFFQSKLLPILYLYDTKGSSLLLQRKSFLGS